MEIKMRHKSAPENTMEWATVTGVSRIIRLTLSIARIRPQNIFPVTGSNFPVKVYAPISISKHPRLTFFSSPRRCTLGFRDIPLASKGLQNQFRCSNVPPPHTQAGGYFGNHRIIMCRSSSQRRLWTNPLLSLKILTGSSGTDTGAPSEIIPWWTWIHQKLH